MRGVGPEDAPDNNCLVALVPCRQDGNNSGETPIKARHLHQPFPSFLVAPFFSRDSAGTTSLLAGPRLECPSRQYRRVTAAVSGVATPHPSDGTSAGHLDNRNVLDPEGNHSV